MLSKTGARILGEYFIRMRRESASLFLGTMDVVWVILTTLATVLTGGESDDRDLCVAVLAPYPDRVPGLRPGWDGGPALVAGARVAAEVINSRTDVLPGYKLHLLEGDSGCDVEWKAVVSLARTVFHGSSQAGADCVAVAGVVGPACTGAASIVGRLLARDVTSLVHVSPSATSPELADTSLYPNTFRLLSSSVVYVDLYRELMQFNEWNSVAALYDSTRRYFLTTFHEFHEAVNVSYFSPVSMSNIPLGDIHASYKIIFVFVGADLARNILCLAYHSFPTLKYPVYQWIFHDRTEDQFWQETAFWYASNAYVCSREQMMQATEGAILNVYRLRRENESAKTDVGMNLRDYNARYQQQLSKHLAEVNLTVDDYTRTAEDWATLYYDAVWAMAIAFSRAESKLQQIHYMSLSQYRYGNPQATALIRHQLSLLDFEGLSGRIVFQNETHEVDSTIEIHQIMYDTYNASFTSFLIGYYSTDGLVVSPAADFVPGSFKMVQEHVHPGVTLVFSALILICTGFLVILHILTIYHKDSSAIRASSPRLSQLIFSGCYLIMFLAFLLVIITSSWITTLFKPFSRNHFIVYGVFCCVAAWNVSAGYTLILSSLVVLLWRVYNIFNHFRKDLYCLSDEWLVGIVGVLLALNCTIQLVWISHDPQLSVFQMLDVVESYSGSQESVVPLRFRCYSKSAKVYDSIVIAINGLLALSLVVLSILNRHIRKKNFKNSGVSVFVYVFIIITLFASFLVTAIGENDITYVVVLWEVCFLSSVFTVSVFLFLPQVREALISNINVQ